MDQANKPLNLCNNKLKQFLVLLSRVSNSVLLFIKLSSCVDHFSIAGKKYDKFFTETLQEIHYGVLWPT
jgi:hypothetical protein